MSRGEKMYENFNGKQKKSIQSFLKLLTKERNHKREKKFFWQVIKK